MRLHSLFKLILLVTLCFIGLGCRSFVKDSVSHTNHISTQTNSQHSNPKSPATSLINSDQPTILNIASGARSVAFLADNKTLVGITRDSTYQKNGRLYGQQALRRWDAETGTLKNELPITAFQPEYMALSNNKKYLAVAGQKNDLPEGTFTRSLEVRDSQQGLLKSRFTTEDTVLNAVAISEDGKLVAAGGQLLKGKHRGVVYVWSTQSKTLLHSFPVSDASIYSLSFSPDTKLLASGGGDRRVHLWNLETGRLEHTLMTSGGPASEMSGWVRALAFSPNGETLACASGSVIELWNVQSSSRKAILSGRQGDVSALCYSKNKIVSGSYYNVVQVWDANSKRLTSSFSGSMNGVISVSISPDARQIAATGKNETILVWPVK